MENNNLSSASLISLAQVLPFCKNLGYFSVLGNEIDVAAGAALIEALKNSRTLVALDCDYENFPDYYKERVGLYTMRNMERLLNHNHDNLAKSSADTSTESLTDQLNDILAKKAERRLDITAPDVVKFIQKTQAIRMQLKETMNDLFKLQWQNELSLDGKETLIRLAFINSSIEKGLLLIDPSLVTKDEPQDPIPIIYIGAAEDEKNKYQIKENERQLMEHSLSVPASEVTPGTSSPMALSRSQSRTSLSNLDRQEGSMLKLLKLHDYHKSDSILEKFGNVSGEEIRENLMSVNFTDLDKMISLLDTLKEKGIQLKQLFTADDENTDEMLVRERLDVDHIKEKIEKLTNIKLDNDAKAPRIIRTSSEEGITIGDKQDKSTVDDKHNINEKATEEDSVHEGEVMRKLYDQVLSQISTSK